MLDMIEQGGKKMNRLVDDLLDLDRLDRGHIQPERAPTDVSELARRVARELPGMESHPIRVEASPVLVDVDAAKVERVIENLLVNARRHTPAGTAVHIRVHGRSNGIVLVIEDEAPGPPTTSRRCSSSRSDRAPARVAVESVSGSPSSRSSPSSTAGPR